MALSGKFLQKISVIRFSEYLETRLIAAIKVCSKINQVHISGCIFFNNRLSGKYVRVQIKSNTKMLCLEKRNKKFITNTVEYMSVMMIFTSILDKILNVSYCYHFPIFAIVKTPNHFALWNI